MSKSQNEKLKNTALITLCDQKYIFIYNMDKINYF